MATETVETCCFCGQEFNTYPNNAEPVVKGGKCCDACNKREVIPYRIGVLLASIYRA